MSGQIAVEEGSSEITAVPKLLELLELSSRSMRCTVKKKLLKRFESKDADYILR